MRLDRTIVQSQLEADFLRKERGSNLKKISLLICRHSIFVKIQGLLMANGTTCKWKNIVAIFHRSSKKKSLNFKKLGYLKLWCLLRDNQGIRNVLSGIEIIETMKIQSFYKMLHDGNRDYIGDL